VANVRVASVYRAFADVSSFDDEVRKLLPAPAPSS
jgi:transcriptional regulator NrdR family protein